MTKSNTEAETALLKQVASPEGMTTTWGVIEWLLKREIYYHPRNSKDCVEALKNLEKILDMKSTPLEPSKWIFKNIPITDAYQLEEN